MDDIASRYWLGGNWSDSANWSATADGIGGASVPTSADNVYWHTVPNSNTYTINDWAYCLDMDWTGATNNPTLAGTGGLIIYGNITLISAMTRTFTGQVFLSASTTGKTITSNGITWASIFNLNTAGSGYTLQDDFINTSHIYHNQGTLNTNGKNVSCGVFLCNETSTRTLTLGSSVITCSSNLTFTSTGLTLTTNTATFIMTGSSKTLAGGDLPFNNVEFQGTPTTITGSNTFNKLKIDSGKTATITAGTTQTITSLIAEGATLQSSSAGNAYTISKASGIVELYNTSIKDCTASGGAVFNATSCTDVSGNTGIIFNPKVKPQGITGRLKNFFH